MTRLRCSECQRLVIAEPEFHHVEPLKPVLTMLLKLAREFDECSPKGESYTAVDFVDAVALTVAAGKRQNVAGRDHRREKVRPAA